MENHVVHNLFLLIPLFYLLLTNRKSITLKPKGKFLSIFALILCLFLITHTMMDHRQIKNSKDLSFHACCMPPESDTAKQIVIENKMTEILVPVKKEVTPIIKIRIVNKLTRAPPYTS